MSTNQNFHVPWNTAGINFCCAYVRICTQDDLESRTSSLILTCTVEFHYGKMNLKQIRHDLPLLWWWNRSSRRILGIGPGYGRGSVIFFKPTQMHSSLLNVFVFIFINVIHIHDFKSKSYHNVYYVERSCL